MSSAIIPDHFDFSTLTPSEAAEVYLARVAEIERTGQTYQRAQELVRILHPDLVAKIKENDGAGAAPKPVAVGNDGFPVVPAPSLPAKALLGLSNQATDAEFLAAFRANGSRLSPRNSPAIWKNLLAYQVGLNTDIENRTSGEMQALRIAQERYPILWAEAQRPAAPVSVPVANESSKRDELQKDGPLAAAAKAKAASSEESAPTAKRKDPLSPASAEEKAFLGLPEDATEIEFSLALQANGRSENRNAQAIWPMLLGFQLGSGVAGTYAEAMKAAKARYPELAKEMGLI